MKFNQYFAFTLSEVLITLAVVGVVAALTLPSVINKAQMLVLKNQYKRVYRNYSNALQKYIIDNDGIPNCTYGGGIYGPDCKIFYTKFINQLKYVKHCNGNAQEGKCIPEYKHYATSSACTGFSENKMKNNSRVWILNDGSIFITYNTGDMPIFAVDVNGMKGPNKSGYDLFSFGIYKKGDTAILNRAYCIDVEPGGF